MIELIKLVGVSVLLAFCLPMGSTLVLFLVAALIDAATHLLGAI